VNDSLATFREGTSDIAQRRIVRVTKESSISIQFTTDNCDCSAESGLIRRECCVEERDAATKATDRATLSTLGNSAVSMKAGVPDIEVADRVVEDCRAAFACLVVLEICVSDPDQSPSFS